MGRRGLSRAVRQIVTLNLPNTSTKLCVIMWPKTYPFSFHHPLDGIGVFPMVTNPLQRRRLLYVTLKQPMPFTVSTSLWDSNRHYSRPRFSMPVLSRLSPEHGLPFTVLMQQCMIMPECTVWQGMLIIRSWTHLENPQHFHYSR